MVAGFLPSRVMLYDANCKPLYDFGSGPYNMVRWNPFGRFLALAGFGNLPGRSCSTVSVLTASYVQRVLKGAAVACYRLPRSFLLANSFSTAAGTVSHNTRVVIGLSMKWLQRLCCLPVYLPGMCQMDCEDTMQAALRVACSHRIIDVHRQTVTVLRLGLAVLPSSNWLREVSTCPDAVHPPCRTFSWQVILCSLTRRRAAPASRWERCAALQSAWIGRRMEGEAQQRKQHLEKHLIT